MAVFHMGLWFWTLFQLTVHVSMKFGPSCNVWNFHQSPHREARNCATIHAMLCTHKPDLTLCSSTTYGCYDVINNVLTNSSIAAEFKTCNDDNKNGKCYEYQHKVSVYLFIFMYLYVLYPVYLYMYVWQSTLIHVVTHSYITVVIAPRRNKKQAFFTWIKFDFYFLPSISVECIAIICLRTAIKQIWCTCNF